MKVGDEDSNTHEVVIVRRRLDDDDHPHHGGAWKIAYADFMTAMMAFFLVMWLINSTDEKTLTQVAAYFNPLKLTDKNPMPKGVHAMSDPEGSDNPETGKAKEKSKEKGKGKPGSSPHEKKKENEEAKPKEQSELDNSNSKEETLFSDPYGVLAKLAAEADIMKKSSGDPKHGSGDAFRDPFDPAFQRQAATDAEAKNNAPVPGDIPQTQDTDAAKPGGKGAGEGKVDAKNAAEAKKDSTSPPDEAAADSEKPLPPNATPIQRERAEVKAEITRVLKDSGLRALPHIEVSVTGEGLLISLTDELNFSMFNSASARPRPELVVAMEKIAKVLASRRGKLIVRGHTDNRPFRSSNYDNWRLSTARAHMAFYMLRRGGVPESRFERVEGYADHHPKLPKTPAAAHNRRIEILLREPPR